MNEKLRAMLAGLTAEELAELASCLTSEKKMLDPYAGHLYAKIQKLSDFVSEPTQLDRIERKLDELLLLARVEFDGDDDDPIEFIGSLDDDEDEVAVSRDIALFGGETCRNCGYNYGTCTCIGGFIDEYEVNENGWEV